MAEHKAHVANWKKNEVSRIENTIKNYKVIAIADMTNMPSHQLQKLRSSLKDSVSITMAKGALIKIAIENLKTKINGIEKLTTHMRGMPALLMTNSNPFKLAKTLKKSKSAAPAKAGQLAPNDILVPAGPTQFPPGPIIGELGAAGLKTTVVDGKVAVKEDKIVVKEGELISSQVAGVLSKLGIEPMEIGISLLAAYESGTIFTKDVLNIDEDEILNKLKNAVLSALNLTVSIAYPTKENIKILLRKAFSSANAAAKKGNIPTPSSVKLEIGKASLEAESLKAKLNLPNEFFETKKKPEIAKKTETQTEEEVAQAVLKKLQDEKMGIKVTERTKDERFKNEEKQAQDLLKKLQDEKIKKTGKKL